MKVSELTDDKAVHRFLEPLRKVLKQRGNAASAAALKRIEDFQPKK